MSHGLGPIPPLDPQADAARRREARVEDAGRARQAGLTLLLALAQLVLAGVAGQWAGGGFSAQPLDGTHAAVGMLLVLLAAHAVGHAALLLFGGVALLALLPRLFRRARPELEPRPPGEDGLSKVLFAGVVALHGAALLVGAMLLCGVLALSSESLGIGSWWRFALAALSLVPLTAWILCAWSRSDL